MVWGTLIAWYLFFAGVSAGAYLTAHYVGRISPSNQIIRKTGYILAPPLLGLGLLLLIFDAEAGLHHPLRFIYLLKNIPGSMMTNGTYIISIFFVITAFHAWMEYKNKEVKSWVKILGIIFALGTAAYTGLLIGVVQAIPLWNTSLLPILFTVSACSTGIAATLFIAIIINPDACINMIYLKKIHASFIFLEVILIFILLYVTSSANEAAYRSVQSLIAGEWSLWFWLGLMIIGLIAPLIIEMFELYQHNYAKTIANLEVAAALSVKKVSILYNILPELFVLIGGFILRFLILAAAIPITLF